MDLAGFLHALAQFQAACISIDDHCNSGAQTVVVTQPLLDARITLLQIFNHLPDCLALYLDRFLSAGEAAQQGWNSNDWQKIILLAD